MCIEGHVMICCVVTSCFYFESLIPPCVFCSFISLFSRLFVAHVFQLCLVVSPALNCPHLCPPSQENSCLLLSATSSSQTVVNTGLFIFCFFLKGFDFLRWFFEIESCFSTLPTKHHIKAFFLFWLETVISWVSFIISPVTWSKVWQDNSYIWFPLLFHTFDW